MFTQLVALDAEQHRTLRLTPNQPFDFARELMLIPVTVAELYKVAREMPIVFPRAGGIPQALVGDQPGRNAHINDTGHWVGRYIPAHLRRYPFTLAEIKPDAAQPSDSGRRFVVQFDAAARHFERSDGYPLLDDQGQPTDLLKKIQKVLVGLQQDQERTQALVAELEAAELLVERHIKINQMGGEPRVLTGLRMVDVKVLAELAAERLAKLRDSGALAVAYAHLLSLTNLEDGLLAKLPAAPKTPPIKLADLVDDDTLSFDWSRLH